MVNYSLEALPLTKLEQDLAKFVGNRRTDVNEARKLKHSLKTTKQTIREINLDMKKHLYINHIKTMVLLNH